MITEIGCRTFRQTVETYAVMSTTVPDNILNILGDHLDECAWCQEWMAANYKRIRYSRLQSRETRKD